MMGWFRSSRPAPGQRQIWKVDNGLLPILKKTKQGEKHPVLVTSGTPLRVIHGSSHHIFVNTQVVEISPGDLNPLWQTGGVGLDRLTRFDACDVISIPTKEDLKTFVGVVSKATYERVRAAQRLCS